MITGTVDKTTKTVLTVSQQLRGYLIEHKNKLVTIDDLCDAIIAPRLTINRAMVQLFHKEEGVVRVRKGVYKCSKLKGVRGYTETRTDNANVKKLARLVKTKVDHLETLQDEIELIKTELTELCDRL